MSELFNWINAIASALAISIIIGQASTEAFNKLTTITDRHRAALICLDVGALISYLSFAAVRLVSPLSYWVPCCLILYLLLLGISSCLNKQPLSRFELWLGVVYPAINFTFFIMEWYVKIMLNK